MKNNYESSFRYSKQDIEKMFRARLLDFKNLARQHNDTRKFFTCNNISSREEIILINKAKNGCMKSLHILFYYKINYIIYICMKFVGYAGFLNIDANYADDLIQESYIALNRCVEIFDPNKSKNGRINSILFHYVIGYCKRCIVKNFTIIGIGISRKTKMLSSGIYMEQLYPVDIDIENDEDMVDQNFSIEDIDRKIYNLQMIQKLMKIVRCISHCKRDSEIFFTRFNFKNKKIVSYRFIAEKFNVSHETVRRVCIYILKELKKCDEIKSIIKN